MCSVLSNYKTKTHVAVTQVKNGSISHTLKALHVVIVITSHFLM